MRSGWYGSCKKCGQQVVWNQTHSGKWAPPYDDTGQQAMLLTTNAQVVVDGTILVHHHCTSADIAAYDARKAEWTQWAKDRNSFHTLALRDAGPQHCPFCGALPFAPCTNMTRSKRGQPNKWPHKQRHTPEFLEKHQ